MVNYVKDWLDRGPIILLPWCGLEMRFTLDVITRGYSTSTIFQCICHFWQGEQPVDP